MRESLLIFILDLADDSINFETSGWRQAAVGLILLFFEILLDSANLTPDNLIVVRALLPTQLNAVSNCFEEYLVQGSDDRRLGLLTRLQRLRLAFPAWPSENHYVR